LPDTTNENSFNITVSPNSTSIYSEMLEVDATMDSFWPPEEVEEETFVPEQPELPIFWGNSNTPVAQNTPRVERGIWVVENPGGNHFATGRGMIYYCTENNMPFTCQAEILPGTWQIVWNI